MHIPIKKGLIVMDKFVLALSVATGSLKLIEYAFKAVKMVVRLRAKNPKSVK